jgi:hypothetical protein
MLARRLTTNIGLGHGLHSLVHRSLLPHFTTQDDDRVPEFMDNGRLLIRQPVLLDRVINASGRRRNSASIGTHRELKMDRLRNCLGRVSAVKLVFREI